jgi:hypothetical protein
MPRLLADLTSPRVTSHAGGASSNVEGLAPKSGRRAGRRSHRAALAEQCQQLESLWQELRADLPRASADFALRCDWAVEAAGQLLTHAPSWIAFYRLVFGQHGLLAGVFPDEAQRRAFEQQPQFLQLHAMLTALRSQDLPESDPQEPQRMITLRIPKTLHDQMSLEAQEHGLSVNRLCISRLLQPLQVDLVPSTQQRPRGKRPAITTGRWSRSS